MERTRSRAGLSEAVTAILLVVIGIAMALMIWQFFTPRPTEELRIGPVDVSGGVVVFTAQNVGSVDAEIIGVACYTAGQPPAAGGGVTPLGGADTKLQQGESSTFTGSCGGAEPGKPINVMVYTKNKAYGPFTVIVRS
ncbi:MAG: hypothetical protein NZ733_00685 [Aigarchaeota archaeon]|nr:hypothetical protein [Aigarchaeota archaeon]MCS7127262.1 hypothetical protein [Candidatus Calditenuaceae archaeon]MCX8203729.1 hypothetical protein [Nitrososphaeria archaeon]MDW8042717.1 hypothetical protein [Nitrososphaerota archaeon]